MLHITLINAEETQLMVAKAGYSLRGFARDVGVSSGYLSEILRNKRTPSPMIAQKIAKGLNVDVEDIFLFEMVDTATVKQ